jgi:hypothetical protein
MKSNYYQSQNAFDLTNLEEITKLRIKTFDYQGGETISAILEKNSDILINPAYSPKLEEGQILCTSLKLINSFLKTG